LNLRKAFENRQDKLLPAFKIGELALASFQNRQVGSGCLSNRRVGSGRLSKPASWLWPAFKSSQHSYEKSVIQWEQRFELAGLKKLFANSKGFAKRLRMN
jgi:hypothetical protein